MKENATDKITKRIEEFYHGEPQHISVEVADGVQFVSDSTFEEDLMEPVMTAAILIESDSPHNEGFPKQHTSLARYSEFGDTLMADVVSQAVFDAGGRFQELVFEFSRSNSDEDSGFLTFLGTLPNMRIEMDWQTNETEINEEYA